MLSGKRFTWGSVFVGILLIFLLGCEERPKEIDLKISLGKLAEEYWTKRLMDRDYKATYSMEAAEGDLPFSDYTQRVHNAGQIQYLSIKVKDVRVDNDNGFVDLTMRCRIAPVPKELDLAYIKDRWVLKSGKWKHVLEKK